MTGGGGFIQMVPGTLEAAGAAIAGVATQTMFDRGNLAKAASGPSDCDPRAAGACSHLQTALANALALLQEETSNLGQEVSVASGSYVSTDNQQMIANLGPGQP